MALELNSPVQYVPRVGPNLAQKLDKLGIKTVEDLLWYAPFRYNDFSLVSPIDRVQPGETVTIRGTVVSMRNAITKTGKRIQQARISDETGSIDVVWFNQPFLTKVIKEGRTINLAGPIDWFGHTVVMNSPEYEATRNHTELDPSHMIGRVTEPHGTLHTGRLVPVYSETAGITSKWLRGRIAFVLEQCREKVFEYLPPSIITEFNLMGLRDAIGNIHFPKDKYTADRSRERLAFDELFLILLTSFEQKRLWQSELRSHALKINREELAAFVAKLPFALTGDQKQAAWEIVSDLSKPVPMNRLLEGDVGSGKTVVAAIAMYQAFHNGFRSVLMAPTQILADQHYQTIQRLLETIGVQVDLVISDKRHLTRKKNKDISRITSYISPSILVGTHALLSESVSFDNVALVVIDEQQRFGVEQRSILRKRGKGEYTPHLLTMTATPIPRTVARTIYGNLDLSVLTEMPKERKYVKTWVVPKEKRPAAYDWIKAQIGKSGGQIFIICPLIEESETLASVKAVKTEYIRLQKIFREWSIGLLHGRLKPEEKREVLERFRARKDAILLSTPVVEVGIDIPNASIMLIEGAERFGLAQLHQLRGRVGRGRIASFCLLFTEEEDALVIKRLKALETIHNGPELAELDLALRGPGELFGTRQHGIPNLKIASLADSELVNKAQQAVKILTDVNPSLTQFPTLRNKLHSSTIKEATLD